MLIYLFPQHCHRKQSHPWAPTAAQELTNPAHPCRMEDDSKAKGISGSHSPAWTRFPIRPLAQHCWPQGKAQGNDCRKSPFLTPKLDLAKHDKVRATLMLLIQPTTSFWRFVFFSLSVFSSYRLAPTHVHLAHHYPLSVAAWKVPSVGPII